MGIFLGVWWVFFTKKWAAAGIHMINDPSFRAVLSELALH